MKYDTIIKCDLKDYRTNKTEYKNCYLLTYKGCDNELEIDLTSNLWFNTEYKATNRKLIKKVENVEELFDFINNEIAKDYKNCDYMNDYILKRFKNNELYCGGCEDYILNSDLSFNRIIED